MGCKVEHGIERDDEKIAEGAIEIQTSKDSDDCDVATMNTEGENQFGGKEAENRPAKVEVNVNVKGQAVCSNANIQVDGEEEIEIPESVDFLASKFLPRLARAHSAVLVEVIDFFSHQGLPAVTDRAVLSLHLEPNFCAEG
jgi:hypothetical protein